MTTSACPRWCTADTAKHETIGGRFGIHEHRIDLGPLGSIAVQVLFDDEGTEPAEVNTWELDLTTDAGRTAAEARSVGNALIVCAQLVDEHNATTESRP